MNAFDRWLFYAANLLVGGSGLVYAVLRYLVKPTDPYAVVSHPAQPLWQHLHIWTAPLLVFAFGHFFYQHALLYWQAGTRPGRRSGLLMLGLAVPMIASGYFLQTAVDESWRQAWIIIHVATSLLWLVGVLAHLFTHYSIRRTLLSG